MKLILITLVGLVVGMMVACSSEPTVTPEPVYTVWEVQGFVLQHLKSSDVNRACGIEENWMNWGVHNVRYGNLLPTQEKALEEHPDKYLITAWYLDGNHPKQLYGSWTFFGNSGKVLSTSTDENTYGRERSLSISN